jgi:hypothetical protein
LTTHSNAQNISSCGFVPTPAQKAQYQAIMTQINSGNAPQQVLTDIPLNASIPLYFWINKENPIPQALPTALDLAKVVERINAYFHFPNNARFTFCGVSYINDSRWYSIPSTNQTLYPTLLFFNTYHKENAIDIYLPQDAGGVNWVGGPGGTRVTLQAISDNSGSPDAGIYDRIFAHELGHVLQLVHTFNELGEPKERVLRTYNGLKPNPDPNWAVTADRMPTPADPYDCRTTCYASTCLLADDNQDTYTLPFTNIMSYHHCAVTGIFTVEQQNKMNLALQTPSDRGYLVNAPCAENIANFGTVSRFIADDCPTATTSRINLKDVNVNIQNNANGSLFCSSLKTNINGVYQSCSFAKNSSITLLPTRNTNYKEGVTTLDVALMSQHILGVQPFTLPFQMLAADVDNNGDIDATDMLYTRRLILNMITTFPNNVGSWRFVPDYFLQQPSFTGTFNSNPFAASFQGYGYLSSSSYMDKIALNMALPTSQTTPTWNFSPFKVGDVNYCSTTYSNAVLSTPTFDPNSLSSARVANNLYTISAARTTSMNSAEERTIVLKTKSAVNVMAFQLGMRFLKDKLKINSVQKGEFDSANDVFDFNKEDKGEFRALWYDKRGQIKNLKAGTILLTAKVKANVNVADLLTVLNLDDQILTNEFYDAKGKLVPLAMEWTNDASAPITNTMTVNAFPNPFTSEVSFDINSPVAGSAVITITNIVTGQSHTSQKQVAQGANVITINNVASLAAGALTYTVVVGTQVVNGTITKAR